MARWATGRRNSALAGSSPDGWLSKYLQASIAYPQEDAHPPALHVQCCACAPQAPAKTRQRTTVCPSCLESSSDSGADSVSHQSFALRSTCYLSTTRGPWPRNLVAGAPFLVRCMRAMVPQAAPDGRQGGTSAHMMMWAALLPLPACMGACTQHRPPHTLRRLPAWGLPAGVQVPDGACCPTNNAAAAARMAPMGHVHPWAGHRSIAVSIMQSSLCLRVPCSPPGHACPIPPGHAAGRSLQ
jgi:hypothetical protein